MKRPVLILALAVAAVLSVAAYAGLGRIGYEAPMLANFVQDRLEIPRMQLIDQNAETRDLTGELTEGALVVINFNYTTCDSICPIGNDVMAQLDGLVDRVGGRPVRLLSITIDPVRDSAAKLNAAARDFDASDKWVWLTGDPNDIESMLRSFDAQVSDIELHDPVFLVGDMETGRFYRSLSMPSADELIEMLNAFAA